MSTPAESLPTDFPQRLAAHVENWKRKLLDLSRRNRALNFKPTKVSTVAIVDEQPAEVFRRLYIDEATINTVRAVSAPHCVTQRSATSRTHSAAGGQS